MRRGKAVTSELLCNTMLKIKSNYLFHMSLPHGVPVQGRKQVEDEAMARVEELFGSRSTRHRNCLRGDGCHCARSKSDTGKATSEYLMFRQYNKESLRTIDISITATSYLKVLN